MKINKSTGSFSSLLIKNYALLALAMMLVFLSIQWYFNAQLNRLLPNLNVEGLFQYLQEKDSDGLSERMLSDFLGAKPYAQVYDGDGNLLFSSQSAKADVFSKEELKRIPDTKTQHFYTVIPFLSSEGKSQYLITLEDYRQEGESGNGYLVLDENLQVLEDTLNTNRTHFTKEEFDILARKNKNEQELYRYSYRGRDGSTKSLIYSPFQFNEKAYEKTLFYWENAWILISVLYILLIAASVFWLNRKTRALLQPLGSSLDNLLKDRMPPQISYSGPKEFVEIYNRFNDLSEKLDHSEKERRKLDQARSKMLTDISHDLKTPITVIQGYAKAIHDDLIPLEKQPQYLDILYQKTRHLTNLIDNFFEYSKLNHPNLPIQLERKDLADYFTEYLAEKYQDIDLSGFQLEVDIPENTPVFCSIDPLQLRRAFDNLIANALKYNEPGVTIFFELISKPQHVIIRVGDDGRGIPENMAESIFDLFTVVDESRGNGGTGLGLAITRRIIDLHGGSIHLVHPVPSPYKTLFEINLPLQ